MTPLLMTVGETKATRPLAPALDVMAPSFSTETPDFVLPVPVNFPFTASAFEKSLVVATRPPTLTCAVFVNRTPFGLTRTTWPFAFRWPSIVEGLTPVTRLNAIELAPGWTNVVVSFGAIEKDCQLMVAFAEFCVTVS